MTEEKEIANYKGVLFYSSILKNKSPENIFYPIVRLIGHRGGASPIVQSVAKTAGELEDFFIRNSNTFIVQDRCVKLVKPPTTPAIVNSKSAPPSTKNTPQNTSVNDKVSHSLIGVNSLLAVEFYFSKLLLKNGPVTVESLMGYKGIASAEIQCAAKNPKELRKLFSNYPGIFIINKDFVTLAPKIIELFNTITSFLSTIIDYSQNEDVTLNKLFELGKADFGLKIANTTAVKECLLKFNNIFEMNGDIVNINNLFLSKVKSSVPNNSPQETRSIISQLISNAVLEKEISSLKRRNVKLAPGQAVVKERNLTPNVYICPPEKNPEISAPRFFVEQLWKFGFCRVISISDLFEFKSQAPKEVQSKCGNNIAEFRKFLLQYPDSFIVTGDNVIARCNGPRKDWRPELKGIEEPACSIIVNFFKNYTRHGKPEQIEKLYQAVGKCFCKSDNEPFFRSSRELTAFLNMFPQIFYISNTEIVNIMCNGIEIKKGKHTVASTKTKDVSSSPSKQPSSASELSSSQKASIPRNESALNFQRNVLSKTQFISSWEKGLTICNNLLSNEKLIALDCEGLNLGPGGIVSLIQIATQAGYVYIFDIYSCVEILNLGRLKHVLESNDILKVIHDSRNDYANLYTEYNISMNKIFDTRVAHAFLKNPYKATTSQPPIGFNALCSAYNAPINSGKDDLKDVYKQNPAYWLKRPLDDDMVAYAALDVACLLPVYYTMKRYLEDLEERVLELSERHSRSCI